MIESARFKNFKALRDTTLPLGRFTLIVGPNGSGKSSALQALGAVARPDRLEFLNIASVSAMDDPEMCVEVDVRWSGETRTLFELRWNRSGAWVGGNRATSRPAEPASVVERLQRIRIFELNAQAIAAPVPLNPSMDLARNGGRLAGVLDQLRDGAPERFEALNDELGRWLPEFDRILFDLPEANKRAFQLRTREGQHKIAANELSQGTLLSLAMLALVYLPDPPSVLCLEEPDRGIHPRLLRQVQDALYRLSYPEEHGEKREPTQVVATTHSPVMLDLYRERPEEIVIANKIGQDVTFERLIDQPNIEEILGDAHLGEIWYTGILGGVPLES